MANNLIPELRFSEFTEDWEEKRLGDITSVERGKFTPRPRNNPIYYNGEIPFVQTGDVVHSKGIINTHSQTLNEKGLKVSKLFKKGDLLITIAANIGYAGVLQYDMACPDSLIGLKCTAKINNYFLNYLLEIEQPKMDYLAVAAAQKNINIEFLKPYKFTIPTLPEQTKIATFLTAVDKRINLLQKKKAELEQYKKGIMQKLFSQTLRFKKEDGSDFEDWEEKKLGEIATIRRGASPRPISSPKWFDEKSKIGWVRISDVSKSNKFLNETQQYLSEEGVKKSRLVQKGNMIMSICATIGKPIYTNFETCIHDGFVVFENPKIEKEYLYYFLEKIQKKWYQYGQPGTQVNLNSDIVSTEKIPYPHKQEQQKIANFLSTIDKSIDNLQLTIDNSQLFKKGLLQKMFV